MFLCFLLDSIVLISIFARFNMWLIFFAFLLLLCCLVCCCATTRCWSVRQIFVPIGVFFAFEDYLNRKLRLVGVSLDSNCLDFHIRWIQHVLVFLHSFLLLCGIVCCCVTTRCYWNTRCDVSFVRWIQLSWFLYSLDSTCLSLFAKFLVVMWLCLLLCNHKMLLKHKVGCFFLFSLDSTVLISIFAGFNMF